MLDPGHSETALVDRNPFPTNAGGMDIACVPGLADVDIVVPAGATRIIYTSNNPFVSCYVVNPELDDTEPTYVVAYPWNISGNTPKDPAYSWTTQGLSSFRSIGKSATVSNVTPDIYKGGLSYSSMFNMPTHIYSENTVTPTPQTDVNSYVITEMPLTKTGFMATGKYQVHDSAGAYLLCRPKNFHWQEIDRNSKALNYLFGTSTPVAGVKCNRIAIAGGVSTLESMTPTIFPSWSVDAGVWTDPVAQSTAVHTVGLFDSCDVAGLCITAPTDYNQTYHLKLRNAFEFLVDSASPYRYSTRRPEPDEKLCQAIIEAMVYLPRQMPESYNGFGKVWEKFRQFYRSKFGGALKAAIGAQFPQAQSVFNAADAFGL